MAREKVKTYRYKCDGMKPVTHAEDGREYTSPMVALCDTTAEFLGVDHWDADSQARAAGWAVDSDGAVYCTTDYDHR